RREHGVPVGANGGLPHASARHEGRLRGDRGAARVTTFAARVPAAFARLSRRRDGRLVAGVCAGLARTARVDPTLVRLVLAFLALAGGAGGGGPFRPSPSLPGCNRA